MVKRILFTGATGFIGSHVIDLFMDKDYKLSIIKRSSSEVERIKRHISKLTFFDHDIVSLNQIFDNYAFDAIIHLATQYRKSDVGTDSFEMYKVNVEFPKKLLRFAIKHNVKKFINTSTYFQYSPHTLPISENSRLLPFNEYAKTKIEFAKHLEASSDQIKAINLIIFSPYGPRDNDKLVSRVVKQALLNRPMDFSEGLQKLDLTFVKDVARAYLRAIECSDSTLAAYTDVCIATGFPTSIREIVSLVEEISGTNIEKTWGEKSASDYPVIFGDTVKAKEILNWSAETDIKSGLKETIDYYRNIYLP